ERLTRIDGRNPLYDPANPSTYQPEFRPLKEFVFSDANNGTDLRQGKLVRAIRHNYGVSAAEYEYEIADEFMYKDPAGRKTDRTMTITEVAVGMGGPRSEVRAITTSMQYDELDLPTIMTYPMCKVCGAPPTDPDRHLMTRTYANGRLKTLSDFIND